MDQYELIRRKHLVDGLSIRAISRELGHSRKTIRKAVKHATPPGYQRCQPVAFPVMDKVAPIVQAWLEQDRQRPAKQRHTAQRIYERLRDEHEFEGSASTVRRYVSKLKTTGQEVFMPLQFDPGEEAQVDWHSGWIIENGVQRKVQFFCMRLCYSKASFVIAYERADLVSFLDGHVRAFAYFDGVPHRIAYDNLKSAVIHVGQGKDRVLNETFKKLRCHYVFETRFCNVARGNEKGDVENLAKRSERTYLTPLPEVTSLDELNEHLLACCKKDLDLPGPRPHQDRLRSALLEEERRGFIELQATAFEACEPIDTTIDKRSLVTVATNRYSAPTRWAHHPVRIKMFVNSVELWCDHQRVAAHDRCHGKGQYILEPTHYLNLLRIKPGSLDNARPFKGMITGNVRGWGVDFDHLRRELEYRYQGEGTKKFINVLLLFTEYEPDEVRQAVHRCVQRRAFSDEAVLGVLRNEPIDRTHRPLDLSHRPELLNVGDGIRPAAMYDRLLDCQEVEVMA
ncbi:MAG: IS21 family transposase [Pirellulaceae bacterium]|nr:IS21 family transposase [Pirellulaceae bacterium]